MNRLILILSTFILASVFVSIDRIIKIPIKIDVIVVDKEDWSELDDQFKDLLISSIKPIIPRINVASLPLKDEPIELEINNYVIAISSDDNQVFLYTIPALFSIDETNVKRVKDYFRPALIIDKNQKNLNSSYTKYKFRALALKFQESNFKSLFNFLTPLAFDHPFIHSKFAQSRNFYVYCDGKKLDAAWYNWRRKTTSQDRKFRVLARLNLRGWDAIADCETLKISTLEYPTSKSKITKVYNSRLINFEYNYDTLSIGEFFPNFKFDFYKNPFLNFRNKEKRYKDIFCIIVNSFYSSRAKQQISLYSEDEKKSFFGGKPGESKFKSKKEFTSCSYIEDDIMANFISPDEKIFILSDGKMYFSSSCKDLEKEILVVLPLKKEALINKIMRLDLNSLKYEIKLSEDLSSTNCEVSYQILN